MKNTPTPSDILAIFEQLGKTLPKAGKEALKITTPVTGEVIASLPRDTEQDFESKLTLAKDSQKKWETIERKVRIDFLEHLAKTTEEHKEALSALISYESGKVPPEAEGEANNMAATLRNTIAAGKKACEETPERKDRTPIGILGLITSFNFPLAVAGWNVAPALLAGNAVIWKPSEKAPLTALAFETIFHKAVVTFSKSVPHDLLQIIVGESDLGHALVANEAVNMISATGSVHMGDGVLSTLKSKTIQGALPILELGGNNAIIISEKNRPEALERAINATLYSAIASCGQRCTDTRRVFVHESIFQKVLQSFKEEMERFTDSVEIQNPLEGTPNKYGFGPLIDTLSREGFETAIKDAKEQGGVIVTGGERLLTDVYPNGAYVSPALVAMKAQTEVMYNETFAPVLFVMPYTGTIDTAIGLANAPKNAGLVNAIYTQNQVEADRFAEMNGAGHGVINPKMGTGTPAHGMGFGGNKASGQGETLARDPEKPFTKEGNAEPIMGYKEETKTHFLHKRMSMKGTIQRIAQDKEVEMDW